jgi:hypothetical protein
LTDGGIELAFAAMATLLVWLFGTGLMFLWFGVIAASTMGMVRRRHFWARAICVKLAIAVLALATAAAKASALLPSHELGLPWLALLVAALSAGPLVLFRLVPDDRGGGPPWDPPAPTPDPPRGGNRRFDFGQRSRRHVGPQPSRVALRRRGSCRPEPRKPAVRPCR